MVKVKFDDGTIKQFEDSEWVRREDPFILLTAYNRRTKKAEILHHFRLDQVQMALAYKHCKHCGEPVEGLAQP